VRSLGGRTKSRNEHEQGRAWEVEVGHECIDLSKLVGWVDEDGGGVSARFAMRCLEGAHGGGADGEKGAVGRS